MSQVVPRSVLCNTTEPGRYIILRVSYGLRFHGEPKIAYADLKRHFAGWSTTPTLAETREAVREIRASKGMLIRPEDEDCRSAGSFFKNPLVSQAEAGRIEALARQKVPEQPLPQYPANNDLIKLSAAWLVEQAGFHKGYG